MEVEFDTLGDAPFPLLLRTVVHAELFPCPVLVGVEISVVVGLGGSGGKPSLLMIFFLFFFTMLSVLT